MGRETPRSLWTTVGVVLAVLVAIGGLVMIAAVILFFVGMSNYGSNK